MADHTITIDPAGLQGEPDFVDRFPTVNDAIFAIASDIDLGLTVDVNIRRGGDAFNDNLTFGTGGNGTVNFNFVDRSPGWYDPGGAARDAYAYVGAHTIALSFRNITINGWMGYGTTLKLQVDFDLGAGVDSSNIVIDGLAQISGGVGLDAGDEFEFAVTDDALRDAIIKEWNLKPAVEPNDAVSFAKLGGGPSWWPGSKLDQFPERYGRRDEAATSYWSLWVDRENGKVYAEKGDW